MNDSVVAWIIISISSLIGLGYFFIYAINQYERNKQNNEIDYLNWQNSLK